MNKLNIKLSVLFVFSLFLFGCSGETTTTSSGGGGGAAVPAAAISSTNGVSLTGVVITQSKSGNSYAGLGKTMTGVGALKSSEPVFDSVMLSEIILNQSMSTMKKAPSSLAVGAVTSNTVNGAVSGTATVSVNTDVNGFGTGDITFSNYSDSNGVVMSGGINITSSATLVTVSFSSLTVTITSGANTSTIVMSGSIGAAVGANTALTMDYKVTITAGAKSFYYSMQNFKYSYNSGTLVESYSGTISDSVNGTITIQTTVPLQYASAAATYPTSGELVISGGGGTKAKMTVLSATSVLIQVDNGSGTYDAGQVVTWASL